MIDARAAEPAQFGSRPKASNRYDRNDRINARDGNARRLLGFAIPEVLLRKLCLARMVRMPPRKHRPPVFQQRDFVTSAVK